MLRLMEARIPEAYLHRRGYYQVRPADIISRADLLLLDVRFAPEDLDGDQGHIHGTLYLPLAEIERFTQPLDTPMVVVCGNGRESVRAAERLAARGYIEVYHLVGGMLRWNGEERPVSRAGSWSHYT
ncbi:MAG: rhodanese-related sulfurtransferase [Polyangiales bacterium]|jgi:rhodanese-related sulfurtransferase